METFTVISTLIDSLREGGVLPYMGYIGKCGPKGCGFSAVLIINRPGGVLPEKLGGGVRPASQNLYPIYDQDLRYSLPYL